MEERLERAEILLRSFLSEQQFEHLLAHGLPEGLSPIAQGRAAGSSSASGSISQQRARDSVSPGSADIERDAFDRPVPSKSNVLDQSSQEFEAVPFAADDDFEWDERESLWTLSDPGGRSASFDIDTELPKLTDGMATLTANDSNTGFLGSVSGASLLRLISSSNSGRTDQSTGMKQEPRDPRMTDIRQAELTSPGPSLRAQPLLTRQFVNGLINAYFAHYHPTFPILHEPTFREQYQNLGNRPKGTWHVLANLVAAMGSFVSSPCNDDTHITLFNGVKNSLSIESLEAGSLGLVQAFAMAANYLQKRNRPNSGYNYGGLALRLAISLGLHKEVHGWKTTLLKKEIRRRVWWSLCVLDVGATVTYGRPLSWPRVGIDTPFPRNLHEHQLTATTSSMPPEIPEATVYTYINTQSSYHLRTMRIYDRLISSPVPTAAELIALDDDCIEAWRTSLPSYYCDDDLPMPHEMLLSHSMGRWRYRVMRVTMYRPFLLRWAQNGFPPLTSSSKFSEAENLAVQRCLHAAESCISVLFRFWTTATHTRLAAWYVLYFLLQAALIPIHCLRRDPSHADAGHWRSQVMTALNVITAMNNINPSAQKCRDIFYRLCGDSLPRPQDAENNANDGNLGFDASPPVQIDSPQNWPSSDPATSAYSGRGSTGRVMSGGAQPRPSLGQHQQSTASMTQQPDPWLTELDSAIDGYDVFVDRLTGAVDGTSGQAGDNMMWSSSQQQSQQQQQQQHGGQQHGQGQEYTPEMMGYGLGLGGSSGSSMTGMWGTDMGDTPGGGDWDWAFMMAGGH